jgi:hypothetical protein
MRDAERGTGADLRGVADAGEQPAQLDRGRELAALLVDGTAASASVTTNMLAG